MLAARKMTKQLGRRRAHLDGAKFRPILTDARLIHGRPSPAAGVTGIAWIARGSAPGGTAQEKSTPNQTSRDGDEREPAAVPPSTPQTPAQHSAWLPRCRLAPGTVTSWQCLCRPTLEAATLFAGTSLHPYRSAPRSGDGPSAAGAQQREFLWIAEKTPAELFHEMCLRAERHFPFVGPWLPIAALSARVGSTWAEPVPATSLTQNHVRKDAAAGACCLPATASHTVSWVMGVPFFFGQPVPGCARPGPTQYGTPTRPLIMCGTPIKLLMRPSDAPSAIAGRTTRKSSVADYTHALDGIHVTCSIMSASWPNERGIVYWLQVCHGVMCRTVDSRMHQVRHPSSCHHEHQSCRRGRPAVVACRAGT
jgi:hypothetical protein